MAGVVNIAEDYSTRTRTGDALITRLVLTGWGTVTTAVTSVFTWTDRGRLWWVYTASSGDLSFYRRATAGSGDKVCSGTASSGLVTLSQANTSGVSGTAEVTAGVFGTNPALDSTGDCIITYADENDLIDNYKAVTSYLDSNSKWEGKLIRFEAIIVRAKRQLDEYIAARLGDRLRRDAGGRRMLADITDPRQLADVHAEYTLGLIEEYRAGLVAERRAAAKERQNKALELLGVMNIGLDYDGDSVVDVESSMASARLTLA